MRQGTQKNKPKFSRRIKVFENIKENYTNNSNRQKILLKGKISSF